MPDLQEHALLNRSRNTGFSLVELMVSMAIGLVLLLGMATLLVNTNSSHREMQKSSVQIENGRYAMQLLSEDIRLAGFYGEYSPPTGTSSPYIDKTASTPVILDPCTTTTTNLGWNNATPQSPVAIYGYAGSTATPTACSTLMPNRPTPATGMPAMITVRRTQTIAYAASAVTSGTTYLQIPFCQTEISSTPFILDTSGFTLHQKDCTTVSTVRKYVVTTYFIDACNICTPTSDGIPTLKMVQFVDGVVSSATPLVEGIENMQFDYGIDNDNDGSPDTWVSIPDDTNVNQLSLNVVAVRIYLLARNTETSAGYTENGTYDMGLAGQVNPCGKYISGTNNGNNAPFKSIANCSSYKRHAYSALVRVENISARRE